MNEPKIELIPGDLYEHRLGFTVMFLEKSGSANFPIYVFRKADGNGMTICYPELEIVGKLGGQN